jgi:hypothetical protein
MGIKRYTLVLSLLGLLLLASPLWAASKIDPGISATISWGLGNMKDQGGDLTERGVSALSVMAFPNLGIPVKLGPGVGSVRMKVGLLGEYRFVTQLENPEYLPTSASPAGSQLKGTGYLLGLAAEAEYRKIVLRVSWDFFGSYSAVNPYAQVDLSKPDAAPITWASPSGTRISLGYAWHPGYVIMLTHHRTTFRTATYAPPEVDETENHHLVQQVWGIGSTIAF